MPRPQGHNHVCIITCRCSANKIARPFIVCPGIGALLLEDLRVAGLLYCKRTIWGYSRFGSVTSYSCAQRTVCTPSPLRSGSSRVHGLSRVPLQAQQSITNSALRLLVTMSGCVPGVSGLWRCSIYSWFGETGWGEQKRANYTWVAQETILTPLELRPKLREGAETEVPR